MMLLAGQLQQSCQFNQTMLGSFIEKNQLSPEEVTMLQSEFISNVVTMFSAQQSARLLVAPLQVQPVASASPYRVPTLESFSLEERQELLMGGNPVFRAGSREPYYYVPTESRGSYIFKREGEDDTAGVSIALNQLYHFPYDPSAKDRLLPGLNVWHYYPGPGLDVLQLDHIIHIDQGTGLVWMQSGKTIPPVYVTSIPHSQQD